ncbi:MAG: hypothetical protein V3S60_05990 [Acidimicrobiia bacterium]
MTDTAPAPACRLPPGPWLIQAYYLATPLFFLVDVFLSFPIRVSALADPGLRYLYYAFALGCGVASRVRPKAAPYVGLAESSLNILLLVLSVMLPILQLPDRVFAGEGLLPQPISGLTLANFVLSGGILVASFHVHQARILQNWDSR